MERLNELHEKYGLSKTREAEDMCNYSQYLEEKGVIKGLKQGREEGREEGREDGREEQKLKDKLDFLKQLEVYHYGDKRIMQLLQVDTGQLKYLREMLLEKRTAVMAD